MMKKQFFFLKWKWFWYRFVYKCLNGFCSTLELWKYMDCHKKKYNASSDSFALAFEKKDRKWKEIFTLSPSSDVRLPPSFQPIRSMKTWNNRDLVICLFSLQEVFARCTSCPHFLSDDDINLCSDRSLRIAGFCLFDTQWKLLYSVSTNLIANFILFYSKCC